MFELLEEWFLQGAALQIVVSVAAAVTGLVSYMVLSRRGRSVLVLGSLLVFILACFGVSGPGFLVEILSVVFGGVALSLLVGELVAVCVRQLLNYVNRREVLVTCSMEEYARGKMALEEANIDYDTGTKGLGTNHRSRMGQFGETPGLQVMYYLFVNKIDKEAAAYAIQKTKQ